MKRKRKRKFNRLRRSKIRSRFLQISNNPLLSLKLCLLLLSK
jgi:hypothetical protein